VNCNHEARPGRSSGFFLFQGRALNEKETLLPAAICPFLSTQAHPVIPAQAGIQSFVRGGLE